MKSKKSIKNIIFFAVISIISLFFINSSLAANTAKINVETANLREEADTDSRILKQLSKGEEVELIQKSGDWYEVKINNITGYLRQDLLDVKETMVETNTVVEEPKESNTEQKDTTQPQEEQSNEQTENNTNQSEETDLKVEGVVKSISEDTKLKIVPSINSTDIIEVKKDEEVTTIEKINGWVCVETQIAKGWIREEKLKAIEEKVEEEKQPEEVVEEQPVVEQPAEEKALKTMYINSNTVNLRKEASKSSDVVAKLPLNTAVEVYADKGGWCKVKVNGKEGYIATSLLSDKKQETSRGSEEPRKNEEVATEKKEETTQVAVSSGIGATVVETAKKYIGYKYVYGATGPNSFDCSGFTSYVYKLHGVSLNRTSSAQYKNGVAVSRSELQPGDLIMFGSSASSINHVGIYIGGGQIVHAANKERGVTTDTINSGYYNKNYVGARRVI